VYASGASGNPHVQLLGYEPPVEADEGRPQRDREPDVSKLALETFERKALGGIAATPARAPGTS
jgi:hypothetical protein